MDRIETLREQASIIRSLARSFDSPALRENLLYVAKRCEQLAAAHREETESEQRS
jgi:two-component sensor histidine kinase